MNELELFLDACQKYRAWLDCGKDLVGFGEVFDAYDKAIDDFTHSLYPIFNPNTRAQRERAFFMVWDSVTKGGLIK